MKYKIIALAPHPWDGPWMNRQQLLSRLSESHPVLYSTGAWNSWNVGRGDWLRSPLAGRTEQRSNIRIYINGLLDVRWTRFASLDRLMCKQIASRWRRQVDRYEGPLVVHIFHPMFADYVDAIDADVLIYHAYDLFSAQPGWNSTLEMMEHKLLARADAIIASSDSQGEYLEKLARRPVYRLFNGVDFELFANAHLDLVPEDIDRVPRPRISYVGQINRKVDLPLLRSLADRHRDWNFVLIGPIFNLDRETEEAYRELVNRSNVHFLGAKHPLELGRYMAASNVNLMCYRIQIGWARFGYPLKLHEYLATGVPVVSSEVEAVKDFQDVISVARSLAEWESAIAAALADDSDLARSNRKDTAARNDWRERVDQLDGLIVRLIRTRCIKSFEAGTATKS